MEERTLVKKNQTHKQQAVLTLIELDCAACSRQELETKDSLIDVAAF